MLKNDGHISLRLSKEMHSDLSRLAEEDERSVAYLIRKFVQEGLDKRAEQNVVVAKGPGEEAQKRLLTKLAKDGVVAPGVRRNDVVRKVVKRKKPAQF